MRVEELEVLPAVLLDDAALDVPRLPADARLPLLLLPVPDEVVLFPVFAAMNPVQPVTIPRTLNFPAEIPERCRSKTPNHYCKSGNSPDAPRISEVEIIFL